MRILFLSNYFPPDDLGGYEQWCFEIATQLAQRNHTVRVLTSRRVNGVEDSHTNGIRVDRVLNLEVESGLVLTTIRSLMDRQRLEQQNLDELRRIVTSFKPDAAFIWGMWNIPRSVPALAEEMLQQRVAYYFCDYWPTLPDAYIQQRATPSLRTVTRLPKRFLNHVFGKGISKKALPLLSVSHPIFVSRAVRQRLVESGTTVNGGQVIYGGTQPEEFRVNKRRAHEETNARLRLLFAGRITPEKGVRTAIRAISLIAKRADRSITLDIVGEDETSYRDKLLRCVRRNGLDHIVSFWPKVPRSEMPELIAQYDALVFPSEWEEPFARIVLESMLAGLVVIGTTIGGTGEVLIDTDTGLTFPPGDAEALARQIVRLKEDEALRNRLALAGQQIVAHEFTLERMADEIEAALHGIVQRMPSRIVGS